MAEIIVNPDKAPVKSHHPEYDDYVGRWQLVKNVVNSHVDEYIKDVEDVSSITDRMSLPIKFESDEARERASRYYHECISSCNSRNKRYRDDAQFVNFTARTKAGLVGAIFRKDTVIELPSDIEYLIQDATGSGVSLNKLAQEIAGEILMTGRYGLLVDYPQSDTRKTVQQVEKSRLKAHILKYDASSIINWQTSAVDGVQRLELIVLLEAFDAIGDDEFTWEQQIRYRVLRMIDGEYWQTVFNEDGEIESSYMPVDSQGNAFTEIPFVFIGSEDNDAKIDSAPLYDLAKVNIGHLRNSADYEESIHIAGSPTLIFTTNLSQEELEIAHPGGVKVGARRGYNLGPGGTAQFLQASPNQVADVAMQRKEEQSRLMGARMTTLGGTNETAEGVRMRLTGETCELTLVSENISDALRKCCKFALMFMKWSDQNAAKIVIKVNTEFFEIKLDPATISTMLLLYRNGVIALSDLRQTLRRAGNIPADRLDDDIQRDVDADDHLLDPMVVNGN